MIIDIFDQFLETSVKKYLNKDIKPTKYIYKVCFYNTKLYYSNYKDVQQFLDFENVRIYYIKVYKDSKRYKLALKNSKNLENL